MFQKIVNKRNFLILNGAIMIIMSMLWLLHITTDSTKYGMLFYNLKEYAELAIVLLLGVMIIDRIKPKNIGGIVIFLISILIGIVVANNQISLFKFSSIDKEWFFRSTSFIVIYLSLITIFVIEMILKGVRDYKVERLIIFCLIGIIISWIFMAYKSTFYINPRPVESYLRLVRFFSNIDRVSTFLCGVGFIIMGLRKSKRLS